MAIQSDETLVTKGDLKTLYIDKILPYLGGNMMMQTGVSDYYSTDEKCIGIWIDGKPLYQKVIDCGGVPKSSVKNVPVDTTIMESIVYIYFVNSGLNTTAGNAFAYPIPFVDKNNTAANNIEAYLDGGSIKIKTNTSWGDQANVYVTIKYTKRADTATSALTTPGCYDINRPDLWPNNKEIFFGNGLYGYRSTGVASSTSMKINAGITPVPTRIINHEITISGTNQTPVSSGYWGPNNFISGAYISPQGELCFALCSDYTNKNYTIWILYNK